MQEKVKSGGKYFEKRPFSLKTGKANLRALRFEGSKRKFEIEKECQG